MSIFSSELNPPASEDSAWESAISSLLLGIGVVAWAWFWGSLWLLNILHVAVHAGERGDDERASVELP